VEESGSSGSSEGYSGLASGAPLVMVGALICKKGIWDGLGTGTSGGCTVTRKPDLLMFTKA